MPGTAGGGEGARPAFLARQVRCAVQRAPGRALVGRVREASGRRQGLGQPDAHGSGQEHMRARDARCVHARARPGRKLLHEAVGRRLLELLHPRHAAALGGDAVPLLSVQHSLRAGLRRPLPGPAVRLASSSRPLLLVRRQLRCARVLCSRRAARRGRLCAGRLLGQRLRHGRLPDSRGGGLRLGAARRRQTGRRREGPAGHVAHQGRELELHHRLLARLECLRRADNDGDHDGDGDSDVRPDNHHDDHHREDVPAAAGVGRRRAGAFCRPRRCVGDVEDLVRHCRLVVAAVRGRHRGEEVPTPAGQAALLVAELLAEPLGRRQRPPEQRADAGRRGRRGGARGAHPRGRAGAGPASEARPQRKDGGAAGLRGLPPRLLCQAVAEQSGLWLWTRGDHRRLGRLRCHSLPGPLRGGRPRFEWLRRRGSP
mmetsp:Transcript_83161/g.162988  ORF Transcript_83161/g.162988 Transcript_83161/m.162988 type:complete len:428 (-) Transcript_83161:128-1411(-)